MAVKRRMFEALGEVDAQNSFLKGLVAIFAATLIAAAVAIAALAFRPATVVAVSETDSTIVAGNDGGTKLSGQEAKRAIQRYLDGRYSWSPETVEASLARSLEAMTSEGRERLKKIVPDTVKAAKEKGIVQRLYVGQVDVDLEHASATVSGDRILSVGGVRAALPFEARVAFAFGERTKANPEGIYISTEEAKGGGNKETGGATK